MRRVSLLTFIFTIFFLKIFAANSAYEALNSNHDQGLWLTQEANLNFDNQWLASFNTEQRWGSDYRLLWYQRYEALLDYNLTEIVKERLNLEPESTLKLLTVGGGFAQIIVIQRNTLGEFHEIGLSRPEIDIKANLGFCEWILKQRFRIEYHHHNASHYKNSVIYRWRLSIDSPRSFTRWEITPYIQNEFFFRKQTYSKTHPDGLVGNLFQDRFRFGLKLVLVKNFLKSDLYWQWRPLKQTPTSHLRWFSTYQVGMSVHLYF